MNWSKTTLPDGIALLAFSLFLVVGGTQISLRNWNDLGISPRAFPYFLAACIAFMGLMLVIGGLRQLRKAASDNPDKKPHTASREGWITLPVLSVSIPPALFMGILSVAYFYLLKPIGFLITTPIYLWITLVAFGSGIRKSLFITVGVVAVIYLAFTYGFLVTLPAGLLRGIL